MSNAKPAAHAAEDTPPNTTALQVTGNGTRTAPAIAVSEMDSAMEQFAGAGLENVRVGTDTLVPRLAILQTLSPQVKRTKPQYIEGAKEGDICDVGLNELIEAPMIYIPVYFTVNWLEWRPERKGLAGIHTDDSILSRTRENEKRQHILPNGNNVVETAQFFGLNCNANFRLSFIPMTSTQLKKARWWNTALRDQKANRKDGSQFTPPMFYRSWELGSVAEQNDQGDWYGWTIKPGKKIDDMGDARQAVFELARDMYQSIKAGKAKANLDSMVDEVEGQVIDGQKRM